MSSPGSTQARLATIDGRLLLVEAALREARGNDETANVAICEQRIDELRADRQLIAEAGDQ